MRQADPVNITIARVQIQLKIRALNQCLLAICKSTNAQFWALKIGENGDRTCQLFFNFSNDTVALSNFGMAAMAHI